MIWGKVCIGWRIEKLRREAEHARLVYDSLPDKNSDTAKGFFALETACNSAAEAMEEILSAFYDALPESDDDANEQQEAISIAQPTNCSLKHDTAFLFCPGCHNRLKRTKMCPDGEWLWCETCQACIKPGTELRVENPDLPV